MIRLFTSRLLLNIILITMVTSQEEWVQMFNSATEGINTDMNAIQESMRSTARQLMMQQFFVQERVRSEGCSGVKQVRTRDGGSENYFTGTHTAGSVCSIHDHANNIRTVGMGELIGVLNGVEFRTRHNDYRLFKPHSTSPGYEAVEEIEFPPIPVSVQSQPTVEAQAEEMQQYFKAWRDQDTSIRDYKPHFKAVLCYLEGAWMLPNDGIEEPFHSDRHFLDALSWFNLMDKARFTSDTGSKSRLENLAFLPTKIAGFINDTIPQFAQWNYRILCHPLKDDLPTNRFHLKEELATRLRHKRTMHQHLYNRAARFTLNPKDQDELFDAPIKHELLDELMEQIPGKDNYQGNIQGTGIDGEEILEVDGITPKDVSRYHRFYRVKNRDAMGLQMMRRAFSDNTLFVAQTTQEKVAESVLKRCSSWSAKHCTTRTERVTYAVPLEIIYLTPLNSWNPHNLPYHGDARSEAGKVATNGNRFGSCTEANRAFMGTNSKNYYTVPSVFYGGASEVNRDAADTVQGEACVEKDGTLYRVRASGVRVLLPPIPGVGIVRQRYPIMPVHSECSSVAKELRALQRYIMEEKKFNNYKHSETAASTIANDEDITYETGPSHVAGHPSHVHRITLSPMERQQLKSGIELTVTTSQDQGHDHKLFIRMREDGTIFYIFCEKRDWLCCNKCGDKHDNNFKELPN